MVLAVFLITAGRFGDLFGIRQLFSIGIVLFTISSLLCGLSTSPLELIVFRAIEGLGAALLLPQTMTFIIRLFPSERRGTALGIWGMVGGVAAVAGPSLGGFIVSVLGWRWIFYINVPIGVLIFIFTYLFVPEIRNSAKQQLDLMGVLLVSLSCLFLTYGLIEGQHFKWSMYIVGILIISVVIFIIFYVQQKLRHKRDPLIPFALFEDRNYTLMNVVGVFFSIGVLGLMLLLSIYFQSILGYDAFRAGLTLVPASLISMCVSPFAGKFSNKIGGKYLVLAGLALTLIGMIWVIFIMNGHNYWVQFMLSMVITGFGNGLLISPTAAVAVKEVKDEVAGAASGVMNTVRQLGTVGGSAAVGALLQNRISAMNHGSEFESVFDISTKFGGHLSGYLTALRESLLLPMAAIALACIACAFVRKNAKRLSTNEIK
nr:MULTISPECIES: DHA2 family efflux MFS transporter permease subunit [Heyndrickxia]